MVCNGQTFIILTKLLGQLPPHNLPMVPGAHFRSAPELVPCLSDTTGAPVFSPATAAPGLDPVLSPQTFPVIWTLG